MANPIQALKIDTNILSVKNDYDELIKYMNNVAGKPINLNLNINQIQSQMQQINNEFTKLNQSLNLNVNSNEINSTLDNVSQKFQVMKDGTEKLTQTTYNYTDGLGKTSKVVDGLNSTTITSTENFKKQNTVMQDITNTQDKYKISIQNLKTKYEDLTSKGNISSQIKDFENSLNNLNSNNFNKGEISNQFKQIEANVKSSSSAIRVANQDAKSFMSIATGDLFKFATWQVIGDAYMKLISVFEGGISYIYNLNNALTQISVVTGKNQQEVEQLSTEYAHLATQMSVTTQEVASAAVEFYRQGLSQTEVMDRLRQTTEYAKISNLSFNQSAEILTATVNGMNVPIQKASDVFAYLGDATATGADEIGIAMQKVAGSASVANISLEKVSSWISEISSKTREDPSSIGSSLNTMISRYNSIKSKGFNEEDGTKLNDITKALAAVGIQATDSQGQLKNFGDILDIVGSRFSSLDKKSQAYLATTMAGTRQQDKFLNLMNGYKDSVSLYEGALNSAGTSQEKYNLWLQGTEAHLNQLKTDGTNLWQKMFNSEDLRTGIDLLASLTNGLGFVMDKIGGLSTIIGIATASLITFKKGLTLIDLNPLATGGKATGGLISGFTNIKTSLQQMSTQYKALNLDFQATFGAEAPILSKVSMGFRALTGTTIAQIAAETGLRVITLALNAAIGFGLGAAISYVVGKITSWINRNKELKDSVEQLSQTTQQNIQTNTQNIQQLQSMESEYNSLKEKTNLTAEEQKKLNDLNNQIAQMSPSVISGYDSQGNAIINLKNGVSGLVEQLKEKNRLENLKMANGYEDAVNNYNNEVKAIEKSKEYKQALQDEKDATKDLQQLEQQRNTILSGSSDKSALEDTNNAIKMKNELLTKSKSILEENNAKMNEAKNSLAPYRNALLTTASGYDKLNDSQKNMANSIISVMKPEDITRTGIGQLVSILNSPAMDTQLKALKELNMNKANLSAGEFNKRLIVIIQAIADLTGGKISKDAIAKLFDMASESAKNAVASTINYSDSLNKMTKTVSDTKSSISDLNTTIANLKDGQSLNIDQVVDLLTKYPELTDAVHETADGYTIETSALESLKTIKIQEATTTMQAEVNSAKQVLESTKDRLKAYGIEIEAIKNLADAKAAADKVTDPNSVDWGHDGYEAYKHQNQNVDIKANLINYGELLNNITSLTGLLNSPSLGASSAIAKNSKSDAKSSSSAQKSAQKEANDALQRAHDLEKQHSDDIIAGYQKQLDQLKQKNELTDQTNQLLKDQNDLMKAQQDLEKIKKNKNLYMYMNDKDGFQWVADQEAIKTAQESVTNAQQTYNKEKADQELKAQEDRLEALIKAEQNAQSSRDSAYQNQKNGYAIGTDNAIPGVSNINENGLELIIGNKANFQGGESVIPHNFTKNLIDWGKFNPNNLLSNIIVPSIKVPSMNLRNNVDGGTHNTIKIEHIELPNVFNGDQFMNEIIQIAHTS